MRTFILGPALAALLLTGCIEEAPDTTLVTPEPGGADTVVIEESTPPVDADVDIEVTDPEPDTDVIVTP